MPNTLIVFHMQKLARTLLLNLTASLGLYKISDIRVSVLHLMCCVNLFLFAEFFEAKFVHV